MSNESKRPVNLVDVLRNHAHKTPDRIPFRYGHCADQALPISYAELDDRARRIATRLIDDGYGGQRVVLLFPTGPDFLCAFLGCLYAGAVAIPTKVPHPRREPVHVAAILRSARPAVVLGHADSLDTLRTHLDSLVGARDVRLLTVTEAARSAADGWREPALSADSLAMLQFTSGSTTTPRGVMVTHGNLMANLRAIQDAFRITPETRYVTWLPHYHDMGLIGGLLEPMFAGCQSLVMSPMDFLSRPANWLRAISETQATVSGGPNFAYDLCARSIADEDRDSFDLGNWRLAFNGAEPINADVIARFTARFEPCGFDRKSFYPCFGLAEGTLLVTGAEAGQGPITARFDSAKLRDGLVALADPHSSEPELVASGQSIPDQDLRIVDPESCVERAPGEIGEIWVSGASVAKGYWDSPDATRETFGGRLAGNSASFLRTGDLGFLYGGQLFVTGRAKDLIIIRGQNHYPQDIEATVDQCHAALSPHGGAAFSITADGTEQLVVVHELLRPHLADNTAPIIGAIRGAIAQQHDLQVHAVALLRPGQLPRTSSGKVQRQTCRSRFLEGSFKVAEPFVANVAPPTSTDNRATAENNLPGLVVTEESMIDWLQSAVARRMRLAEASIDIDQNFSFFGLDSVGVVSLAGELEQQIKRRLSPTILYEFPTIRSLAGHLAGKPARHVRIAARTSQQASAEPIAIVGMAGRFPGAETIDEFWHVLLDGVDCVGEAPARDWIDDGGRTGGGIRRGGFLPQVDLFDAEFFGISPREARSMDPQQRILLEVATDALADAGIDPHRARGSATGVFIGISNNDHLRLAYNQQADDFLLSTGNANSIAANRLSYQFDLRGPSLAIDSACSSSLVAVHHACQSLRLGECDVALAGGVNLILSHYVTDLLARGRFLSPNGQCRAFDKDANGYVRGEGAGIVVLKPLSLAVDDGDAVYAVIHGSAVNQDGRANGLTAPNPQAQRAVLQAAYEIAGVAPHDVEYVEAHGTGTALGDPIEARVLGEVLGVDRPSDRPCLIGSVKTNIGHLEAAAGIAGLIKTALMLDRQEIPPSLHFRQPNPLIPFDELRLRVPTNREGWPRRSAPSIAGVSSFGFGGTNVHVVLNSSPIELGRNQIVVPRQSRRWQRKRHWLAPPTVLPNTAAKTDDAAPPPKPPRDRRAIAPSVSASSKLDLITYLRGRVAAVLMADPDKMDADRPLPELGVDSVMATELAYRVEDDLAIDVSISEMTVGPTIRELADRFYDQVAARNAAAPHAGDAEITSADNAEPGRGAARSIEFPLSDVQRRLWFLGELAPDTGILNIPVVLELKGTLDINVLQRALGEIVRYHSALHSSFHVSDDRITQSIDEPRPVALRMLDLREVPLARRREIAEQELNQTARRRFDATGEPLLRATLLRMDDDEHRLGMTVSHLVSDGWSMRVLSRQLAEVYGALGKGEPLPLPEPGPQFSDLLVGDAAANRPATEHRGTIVPPQFDEPPAVLPLPYDQPRPVVPNFRGERCEFELPDELTAALLAFSRELGVTPFMTLLAGFQTILCRYTGQTDIMVGVPFSGRNQPATRDIVGPLMNPLPIRVDLSDNPPVDELLKRTRAAVVAAQRHQEPSSPSLAAPRVTPRAIDGPRMYQVMFDMQDAAPPITVGHELIITPHEANNGAAMVDITLSLRKSGGRLSGHVQYDSELFEPVTIERFIGHYVSLLAAIVTDTNQRLATLPLLTEQERQRLLVDGNATRTPYPSHRRLETVFCDQVRRHPHDVAVVCGDQQLTYTELDARTNRVARLLADRGIGPRDVVGVLLDRSIDVVVALWGVLKSGAAYVPIDPTYPAARQQLILDDAQARCVIASPEFRQRVPAHLPIVDLADAARPSNGSSASRVIHNGTAGDLAYVLYTSGSTGKPKGVMVTHRNVVNFFAGMDALQNGATPGVWLAVTSISFDISVFELLWTIGRGYRVVIQIDPLAAAVDRGPDSIARQIERHRVTHFQGTPPLLRMLMDNGDARRVLATLEKLFVGGDALPADLARDLAQTISGDVYNMYGPTETTVWSTADKLDPADDRVSVGRPLANTQVYVLDSHLQPLPVGVPGELFIGGDGVTRGYHNRPDLTAERFLDDPFCDQADARLYRTGDLVRFRDDGRLEFLGRIDQQTKIRGHRIELGDIEATLRAHAQVKEAVVVVSGDDEHTRRLVAYVIPNNGKPLSPAELQGHLRSQLPPYMIPAAIICVPAFQLTPNGKIDRRKMAALAVAGNPSDHSTDESPVLPGNDQTSRLVQLIRDELAIDEIAPDSNLLELGVTSMEIARVANRMERELGWRPAFADFFRHRTVRELVAARYPESTGRDRGNGRSNGSHAARGDAPTRTESREFEEGVL